MLKLNLSKQEFKDQLDTFVWTFKIGDNILYNFDVILNLVDDHNSIRTRNYAKPISILCISVVEAILVDFLERLSEATNHFPNKLVSRKTEIKNDLNEKKSDFETAYEGKIFKYKRLKNFGYKELIEFYGDYRILGGKKETYESLQKFGQFRNRVHIRNYFGNFERNESRTFSERRTQQAIECMEEILKFISKQYPRP